MILNSVSSPTPAQAMLQADDEDDLMEERMKSPFGSSFRTFNATDYKPIGKQEGTDIDHVVMFWCSLFKVLHFLEACNFLLKNRGVTEILLSNHPEFL